MVQDAPVICYLNNKLHYHMRPDYPSKYFNDKRVRFILLIQSLDAIPLV